MSDFQAIADRVEIEAPGEFTGTATMRGGDRFASLFTHDGVFADAQHPRPGLPRPSVRSSPGRSARAQKAYGQPSTINHLLILNAEPRPGRSTVLLLRQATGF